MRQSINALIGKPVFLWLLVALLLAAGAVVFALAPGWAGWGASLFFIMMAMLALAYRERRAHRAEQAAYDRNKEAARQLEDRLSQIEREQDEARKKLQAVIALNHELSEAASEQALMDSALSILTELTGALGCSFVPVDEWNQPLPAFTHGSLPAPVLSAWAEHLAGAALRERCGRCEALQSSPGNCPLHPQSLGNSLSVSCLPLLQTDPRSEKKVARRLGILNLYLPAGSVLSKDLRDFIEGLLKEIALAVESVKLREQEIHTLQQIQMVRPDDSSIQDALRLLMEGLQQALDVQFVSLRLRDFLDGRLSGLTLQVGELAEVAQPLAASAFDKIIEGQSLHSPEYELPAWLALPVRQPDHPALGMLLAGCNTPRLFNERHEAIARVVAAQAALLVENDRLFRSLEYKAVIQERSRLAREIHDGLAQTLAYLKLQAAQMQIYLDKGDQARLAQVLKENYQALSEAYLDTRQAIDYLRVAPERQLDAWLEQVAADFEANAHLPLERRIQTLSAEWMDALTPEIQAQLVRIVQEALTNIRKHAGASRAWIALHEWQDDAVLEIGDDGRGFEPEGMPGISHHGLRGMRERAEMIGADFQIISQDRQGTTVRLVLPSFLKEANQ